VKNRSESGREHLSHVRIGEESQSSEGEGLGPVGAEQSFGASLRRTSSHLSKRMTNGRVTRSPVRMPSLESRSLWPTESAGVSLPSAKVGGTRDKCRLVGQVREKREERSGNPSAANRMGKFENLIRSEESLYRNGAM